MSTARSAPSATAGGVNERDEQPSSPRDGWHVSHAVRRWASVIAGIVVAALACDHVSERRAAKAGAAAPSTKGPSPSPSASARPDTGDDEADGGQRVPPPTRRPHRPAPERAPLSHECTRVHQRISEVIDSSYLSRSFESMLKEFERLDRAATERKCPAWLSAEIWMYAGIVYGSGLYDFAKAKAAFARAIALDLDVQLDADLCLPAVVRLFDNLVAAAAGPPPTDASCSSRSACAEEGRCRFDAQWLECAPATGEDCRSAQACVRHRRCRVGCVETPGLCAHGCVK